MQSAEARVAFVVRGVVLQAMQDARMRALACVGARTDAVLLLERWCGISLAGSEPALRVSPANKTELLLSDAVEAADLYPLGDLYASELTPWGGFVPDPDIEALAREAGGIDRMDAALRRLLDERRPADAAFADLPHIRDAVMTRLQKTRFRRAHAGLVPKLGARTIGIDLHI
jgi:hypothetical protein